jgi:NAD(P)-dependent dehydrogenase (short-subunit alcohol dehydrogenase family)
MADWIKRFSLDGRKAMVTGASKGIGAEIARVFADAGADIVAVARDGAGLADTAEAVRALGRRCLTIPAELGDAAACTAAAERALAEWGTIDILVNSAGISRVGPAETFSLRDWDETMAVNLRAPFLLSQALAPAMIAQRWGKIVNISSQTGVIALDDHAAYAASKGGLNALTKSLCAEWARHNVQVNAICPTVVLTPMGIKVWSSPEKSGPMIAGTPLRRFGQAVEIADAALYLASPAAELVNGAILMIEGGYSSV